MKLKEIKSVKIITAQKIKTIKKFGSGVGIYFTREEAELLNLELGSKVDISDLVVIGVLK